MAITALKQDMKNLLLSFTWLNLPGYVPLSSECLHKSLAKLLYKSLI